MPLGYPPFSLKDDAALRKDMLAAMNHRGVTISLGDGFLVLPGADMRTFSADLDVLAELGVPRINVVSLDPDLRRTFDQFAALAELAAQRGIQTDVEPVPGLTVGDLPTALAAVAHVGTPRLPTVDRHHAPGAVRIQRRRPRSHGPRPHRLRPTQRHDTTAAHRQLHGGSHV